MNLTYTYCPRCGGVLGQRETAGRVRPACPACGLIVYLNPRLAAGVIPVLDGKAALVRRAMDPSRGLWVFPGGYVDMGEDVAEAARREVWEETGLHVRLERLLGVYSRTGDEVVLIVYVGQVIGGDLTAGDEEIEAAWFAAEALPAAEQLGFWSTAQAVQDWRSSITV